MPFRRSFFFGVAAAIVLLPAFCQHPPPRKRSPGANEDMAAVARGQTAFKSNCGFCHGNDARGSRAPDLIRSTLVNRDEKGNLIGPVIRNGRPDKGMPAFAALTDDQISDIAAFLHHSAVEALRSGSVAEDYPLKKLLTGNAAEGKAYFEGKGGCSSCHSVTGDLAGIAKKYSPIDLQQHMVYPGRRIARTAVVIMPDGTKYEGKIEHDDEFTIAITCQDGWYRSWPRSEVKVEIHDPLAKHRELMEHYTDADVHNLFAYLETLK
jgi:cytochrome c oxidase cbb3-type subunit III